MPVYLFGPFVLDSGARRLTRGGRSLSVPAKAWQILERLVEARGDLVTHESLRAALWPNVVVEERTLTVHVSTLRKALGGDSPSDFIETVPRAGYRLAVPVRTAAAGTAAPPATMAAAPPTLAIRPFAIHPAANDDAYLGVGLADAVSTTLGALPGLAVWPLDAVGGLAGNSAAVEACRALGVGHLLEGEVVRDAGRLSVLARLIDVSGGRAQRDRRFDGTAADGAALQDALANWVATALPSPAPLAAVHTYRPRSSEAYYLQLEARAHLKPFTRLPLLKALTLFEQALRLDPDYAQAHAGLASAYVLMASTAMLRPLPAEEAMPLARRSAERALALDERLAEAWAVLGRVRMEFDWDWHGAEADLAHAVALNDHAVEALAPYGTFLSGMGRHDEAIAALERARLLDPRRVETLQHLSIVYWMAGRPAEALARVDESLRVEDSSRGHYGRMMILDQLGRRDEAMAERLATLRALGVAQGLAEQIEALAGGAGWQAAMTMWIGLLERTGRWEGAAMQWMAAGHPERALDALEHCLTARTTYLYFTAQNPCFQALHGHPRFRAILDRLGLAPPARSVRVL